MNKKRGRRGTPSRRASSSGARKPRLDASRAPKRGGGRRANEWRSASRSVFAAPQGADAAGNAEDRGRRLNQVLAAAGYGSRRACEELIVAGRVAIDGKVETNLAARVNPFEQKIQVDGESLPKARPVYVAFNKPKNTLCTNWDPSGRRRVVDFMPAEYGRLFPVGRLDRNSEGLILLTNDGALAERLTHPRFEAPKKYRVQVAGLIDAELADALKRGVHIAEGIVQADEVVVRSRRKLSSVLEITLTEGKNREIRRMLARVGHKVMQLQRIQVGSIKLGKLAPGESRRLTATEVAELYRMTESRPDLEKLDGDKPHVSIKPVEVAQLAEREEEKA
ncbi:MAG: rRNA pseudouridine synthase, partial [Thermoguttaceae bacterium]|nr:rRNA pseudouridine synthase [Thermoguttaceae bacterium]